MTRIAVPTNGVNGLSEAVAEHFGRCQTYTFLNSKGEVIKVINNTSEHMEGIGLPPVLLKKEGADILLCKDLGPKALSYFHQFGISVCVDQAKTVKEIYQRWKSKKLKPAGPQDTCQHHSS